MTFSRELVVVFAAIGIALAVYVAYPTADLVLQSIRAHAYLYPYWTFSSIETHATSTDPAVAVPVLMYHGVIQGGELGPNTSRQNFIEQMELLKKNGYTTLSVKEYDLFRQGLFTLPPKPIVITFDDGRRDSYYTTDAVFERLGFKATMFIATVRANRNDPFYLNWDEIKELHGTGRWEVEAHGRESHEDVLANAAGNLGSYLTTRVYMPGSGVEPIDAYERRVDADYVHGNSDLYRHLGYAPQYFAVPLNDYGGDSTYDYEGALAYNQSLAKLYYRLAFVQALHDETGPLESFYNYHDSDPHRLRRLEVMDMTAEELLAALERFAPRPPEVHYETRGDVSMLRHQLLYGILETKSGVTLSTAGVNRSARMLFGDWGWRAYQIKARLEKNANATATVLANYIDEENYIGLLWGVDSLRLVEVVSGKETELAYTKIQPKNELTVVLSVADGKVSAQYNDAWLVSGVRTESTHGAPGTSVWQRDGVGSLTIDSLSITPLATVPLAPVVETPQEVPENLSIPEAEVPPRALPYLPTGMVTEDWDVLWGPVTFKNGTLFLNTASTSKGSGVQLTGADYWKDYTVDTRLDWFRGRSLSFLVRYVDEDNYASCSFAPYGSGVRISVVRNGIEQEYGQNYTLGAPYYNAWLNNQLGVRVKGNHIECLVRGVWVLRADPSDMPEAGGVRIETWDKDSGVARIELHELTVRPE